MGINIESFEHEVRAFYSTMLHRGICPRLTRQDKPDFSKPDYCDAMLTSHVVRPSAANYTEHTHADILWFDEHEESAHMMVSATGRNLTQMHACLRECEGFASNDRERGRMGDGWYLNFRQGCQYECATKCSEDRAGCANLFNYWIQNNWNVRDGRTGPRSGPDYVYHIVTYGENFRIQTTTLAEFEPYTEANYNPAAGGKSRLADAGMCVTSMFQKQRNVQTFLDMAGMDMGYANSQGNVNQRVLMERLVWLYIN